MPVEKAQKFGMIGGWPNQSDAADWRMHIPSPVFAPCNVSKGCSAIPRRASSRSCGGEKNGVRRLWYGTSHLVRPPTPAGAGFALRRLPTEPWRAQRGRGARGRRRVRAGGRRPPARTSIRRPIIVGEPLVRRKPAMRPAMSARLARRTAAAVPKRERRHKECAETEGARATGTSRRAY